MAKLKRNKKVIVGIILGTVLIGSSSAYATINSPFGTKLVGRQSNGAVLTVSNQFVTPAGKQLELDGNPISVAVRPDEKTAVVLNGRRDYGGNGLNIVNLTTGKQIDTNFTLNLDHMWGLAYSPDGSQLYATGSKGSQGQIIWCQSLPTVLRLCKRPFVAGSQSRGEYQSTRSSDGPRRENAPGRPQPR